jgi:hypothetical protein
MSSRAYIITEGVHDVAILGRLLGEALQLKRVVKEAELDKDWSRLLPKLAVQRLAPPFRTSAELLQD